MAILLALCLVAVAPPLPFQEPSPVPRLFLQPAMDAPEGLAAGRVSGTLRLLYSNSILEGASRRHTLDIDMEEAHLLAELRWAPTDRVELRLALPVMLDWGGFLDAPIDAVERLANVSNPERLARARGRTRFLLTGPGGAIDRSHAGGGMGDVVLGARLGIWSACGPRPAIALRAAVKVPSAALPWGSGTLDVGGGVLAGWRGERTALRLALDVTAPTAGVRIVALDTRPFASAQAALARSVSDRTTLHVQLSAHGSPIRRSGIRELDGPDAYVVAGATTRLPRRLALELGVAEGIFSPYRGTDLTLLIGARLVE